MAALNGRLSDGLGHAETSGVGAGGGSVAWTGTTWSTSGGTVANDAVLSAGASGGKAWALSQRLGSETYAWSLAHISGTGDSAYLVAGTGATGYIYRSTDGGQTWTQMQRLGSEQYVQSIAHISGDGDSAYLVAGTYPTGYVYRSTNGGQTWTQMQRLGSETQVLSLAHISGTGDSAYLVAGTGATGYVYRSTDGGQTWTQMQRLGSEQYVFSLAHISGTGDSAYLVAGTYALGQVYRSCLITAPFAVVTTATADVLASANLTIPAASHAGIVINLDSTSDPQNYVTAIHNRINVVLEKCVAGVKTRLIDTAATYSAGATLMVWKSGTAYRVYYNNVFIGTQQTISDAGIISNTKHGITSNVVGNTLDNFVCYATGTGNEYAVLDTY